MLNKNKFFFWSPMLSNVGTINAIIGMAKSLSEYSNSKIYVLDILGEFKKFHHLSNITFLPFININNIFPKTGKLSKFLIISVSILAIPFLIRKLIIYKPKYIITGLVGFIPILLKFFFKHLVVINSIQGYPKFNIFRKLIWKFFYKKTDYLLTMTNKTKQMIEDKIEIDKKKIFVIENPVISRNIKNLALESIDLNEQFIFKKKVYCAVGRLTFQKNFFELLEGFKRYSQEAEDDFNLIILGEGELKNTLAHYIKKNNLDNFYLLGFKSNPYKYLQRSDLYISTSLWEEPGHTLIEAGYLNVPILTSNCPNGPHEIIIDGYNGLKYQLGSISDLVDKIKIFNTLDVKSKKNMTINFKKIVANYTQFRFCKKLFKIIV
ncbi:MAG: glycosyltransferase [Pelagibacteraceae bacterium]|nr:glycosyltransferase [Pelagibacteraceae bacterium]